jgi:hypothetical protein
MFVKWTICTQHEFFPYSFNISMSNMVIMHIQHSKLIWETLCWFAHLDVKWTISSFDTRKLNLTCLCQYAECVWMSNEQLVHATWIFYPCPFNMFWLLTRCQINMSNEHHFCIFAKRVALLVIALFEWQRLPKIEFPNQIFLSEVILDFFYCKMWEKNSWKSPDSTIGFQCVAMNIGGWLWNLYFVSGL